MKKNEIHGCDYTLSLMKLAGTAMLTICLCALSGWMLAGQPAQQRSIPPAVESKKSDQSEKINKDFYDDPLPEGAVARLGSMRFRHATVFGQELMSSYSPDGKWIMSASEIEIRLWDAQTGKLQWSHPIDRHALSKINTRLLSKFVPDGKSIMVLDLKRLVFLDRSSGKVIRQLAIDPTDIRSIVISHDGVSLACVRTVDKKIEIELLRRETGKSVWRHDFDPPYRGSPIVSFSADSRTLTAAWTVEPKDKPRVEFRRWEVESGNPKTTVVIEHDGFSGSRLSNDGTRYLTRSGTAHTLWDAATGKQLGQIEEDISASTSARVFFVDDRRLCVWRTHDATGERTLSVRDSTTLKTQSEVRIAFPIGQPQLSPDQKTILTEQFNHILLWDAQSGKRKQVMEGHTGTGMEMAYTPDGKRLITACNDRTVRIWNARTGEQLRVYPFAELFGKYIPAGTRFLGFNVSPRDDAFRIDLGTEMRWFAVDDGKEMAKHDFMSLEQKPVWLSPKKRPVAASVFGPDYRLLAISPQQRFLLFQHSPQSNAPALMKGDGPNLAETHIALWDTSKEQFVLTLPSSNWSWFSSDLRMLAGGESKWVLVDGLHQLQTDIRLCELASGEERLSISLEPMKRFDANNDPNALAFSPDGRILAVARGDNQLDFFDMLTGHRVATRSGLNASCRKLVFRPDGKLLAGSLADASVLVWDMADIRPAELKAKNLTQADLDALWRTLGEGDAKMAFVAIRDLVAASAQAAPFLSKKLRPVEPVPAQKIKTWIEELDSERFKVRETAHRELHARSDEAESLLREALKASNKVEQRQRIEKLLTPTILASSLGQLQAIRAIEALERMGSMEAKKVLEEMAAGATSARLTREAVESLERLRGR